MATDSADFWGKVVGLMIHLVLIVVIGVGLYLVLANPITWQLICVELIGAVLVLGLFAMFQNIPVTITTNAISVSTESPASAQFLKFAPQAENNHDRPANHRQIAKVRHAKIRYKRGDR